VQIVIVPSRCLTLAAGQRPEDSDTATQWFDLQGFFACDGGLTVRSLRRWHSGCC